MQYQGSSCWQRHQLPTFRHFLVKRSYSSLLILLVMLVSTVHAAHSRRRVVTRQESPSYDREITTFNPKGRLEQVEYGMIAAERGSPIAVLKCNQTLWVALESSQHKIHRIDHNKFLLTAGLSGDGRLLAQRLRSECQDHILNNGEVATLKETAQMAAGYFHSLTRIGGVRPMGCHAIVVGVEGNNNDNHDNDLIVRIYQSDPGGGMEECPLCTAAGRGKDKLNKELFKLTRDLEAKDDDDTASVAQKLVQLFLQIQQQEGRGSKQGEPTIDLWRLAPKKGRRGNMLATVYTHVDKNADFKEIVDSDT
jgi:20S proteasome alpha/beta subunit